jgi:hypothetical protein
MASVRVGLFPPVGQRAGGPEELHATLARTGEEGVDHLCVGDHVSFFVGAGSDGLITAQMQNFYQMPFEPFERYSPYGTPADVAEFLSPYVEAGCSAFNVIPCASDDQSAIAAVGELRTQLTAPPKRLPQEDAWNR